MSNADFNEEQFEAEKQAAIKAAVAVERARWKALRDQLDADIGRPDGRWGIHGHAAVDDDYFQALKYAVERMDDLLGPNDKGNRPA